MIQEITKTGNRLNPAPAAITSRRDGKSRWEPWIPYALALVFFLLALRGVGQTDVIDTDAARHAMNGAFIYDLVRTGHWAHPVEYAKAYYAQYPALSMPYHPPLFPAVEAIFFAIFGVNLLTARLLVALCVGLSAALLYRLMRDTLGGPMLATCVTIASFSLWTVQLVGRDVMLEFPAMVFTLAALYCLRDMSSSFPMRRAIFFAIFAAMAVWTKQHAVFLGAVPFLDVLATRRWRRFREAPFWVGSILFGGGGARADHALQNVPRHRRQPDEHVNQRRLLDPDPNPPGLFQMGCGRVARIAGSFRCVRGRCLCVRSAPA